MLDESHSPDNDETLTKIQLFMVRILLPINLDDMNQTCT